MILDLYSMVPHIDMIIDIVLIYIMIPYQSNMSLYLYDMTL